MPSYPAAPSGYWQSAAANGLSLSIGWTDSASNETGYQIAYCQGTDCSNWSYTTFGANSTSWSMSTAACSVYRFAVQAFNAVGGSSWIGYQNAYTPCAPSTPSGYWQSAASNGTSITIGWTDNAGNETNYTVA
jgi:titin